MDPSFLSSPVHDAGETQPSVPHKKECKMADPTYETIKSDFLKTFSQTGRYLHRYEVFHDFITMSAISLRNAMFTVQELEDEYLKLIGKYKSEDQKRFPLLLSQLVQMLEFAPRDVLGELYQSLELSSKDKGQFFTPSHLSDAIAQMTYGEDLERIDKPFITLADPASGPGGMILAFVKVMISKGHNPADKLWVQCVDVDRMVALMCYIQLTLWHVPAEVIVGNSLSLVYREFWYTPAHFMGNWSYKLKANQPNKPEAPVKAETVQPVLSQSQFDFGF